MSRTYHLVILLGVVWLIGCSSNTVLSTKDQLQKDLQLIDQYIQDNGIDSVLIDDSEIRYVIHKEGTGIKPILSDIVRVDFVGTLLDGTVFDSGNSKDFVVNQTIQAWRIMLPKMREGADYTIFVPSSLGYGFTGTPSIPGNSILIFNIQLIRVGN